MRNVVVLVALILTAFVSFNVGRTYPTTSQKNEVSGLATSSLAAPLQTEIMKDPVKHAWNTVVKVVDGDTFAVSPEGRNETIRLIGIDTPETVDPRKTVQCFGKEASEKAKALLSGNAVRLEMDPTQGERDKYGRLLAYAFLKDGTNVAKYLILEGYGHEYTYTIPYKYQTEFMAAEKMAREEKRGLWADGACDGAARPGLAVPPADSPSGMYECSRNEYNCSDFATQAEAQGAFDFCGGSDNDIHKLDSDGDGRVCESLP